MNFNTLEIIGLAFLSGLHVAETAEEVKNEKVEEQKEEEKDNEEVTTRVVKLEGEKAKKFMKFVENMTKEEK